MDLYESAEERHNKVTHKMKKTSVKPDNNSVLVNANNILWVCPLAMNKEKKCTYCKCHKCFKNSKMFTSTNRVTRGCRGTKRLKSMDDRKLKPTCGGHSDHTLQAWTDSLFFTKQYKMKNKKNKNSNLPVKCANCGNDLVDKL